MTMNLLSNILKRFVVLAALILISIFSSDAQNPVRKRIIHKAALQIAEQIKVNDTHKDLFIDTYQSYKKEMSEILSNSRGEQKGENTISDEGAIEAKILSDFDKSEKILSLRKKYYKEFRKFLRPSQIQHMYDLEKDKMKQQSRYGSSQE